MVRNKDLPTIFSFFTSIFFLDRHHFFVYHIYFHIYTSIFIRHSRQIPQISPSTSDCRVKKVINMCSVGLFGSIFFIIFYIIFFIIFLFFQSLLVQKKTNKKVTIFLYYFVYNKSTWNIGHYILRKRLGPQAASRASVWV